MTDAAETDFLDLVYGAAVEPELWVPVLERYADAIGGEQGWLSLLDVVDGSGGGIIARIDPTQLERYVDHFADRNPLFRVDDPSRFLRSWAPRILTDEDWMPKSELMATEYYNDFLRPQDIHSGLMVRLAVRGSETATINIGRSARRGQFDRADLEVAQTLHPHLIRAFALGQKLAAGRLVNHAAESVFERSPHGLFLLDQRGRVQRANSAGEAMLAASGSLRVINGQLTAASGVAADRLQRLIAAAASPDADTRMGGATSLPSPSNPISLSVMVAPIRLERTPFMGSGCLVLVCATDLEAGVRLPELQLRELFSLTPAEARVALALFEGATPKEAATRLSLSPHTVHVHLAHIFEKTGTHRQSGLVRLMMRAIGLDLT